MGNGGTSKLVKYVVLSMDVEDWYHVEYLDRDRCDRTYSMLDGIDVYLELLARRNVRSSFFCTGEIADAIAPTLREMCRAGHEVGSHTQTHKRPLLLSTESLVTELHASKRKLEDILGTGVNGFRAPCFSLDDAGLEAVRQAGYSYDSSRIAFGANSMYGRMELNDFEQVRPFVFRKGGFFEFEMSTVRVAGRRLPVSGGGYLRMFPWWLMQRLVQRYVDEHSLYLLYIHPYELSRRRAPTRLPGVGFVGERRFRTGLGSVERKLDRLITQLTENDFTFTTFGALRSALIGREAAFSAGTVTPFLAGGEGGR